MLVVACAVLAASLALTVRPDGRVGLAALPRILLPPLCLSREWFGVGCPGCGLTRSFVHFAHGDVRGCWQAHRLGLLLAVALLIQIPYRVWALARRKALLSPRASRRFGDCLIALLLVNWLLGLLISL
jgi:hypothetical protein